MANVPAAPQASEGCPLKLSILRMWHRSQSHFSQYEGLHTMSYKISGAHISNKLYDGDSLEIATVIAVVP